MSLLIREANRNDSGLILRFVKELARYENAEHAVIATESSIESSIFSESSTTRALICEKDGCPIGFAVYFFNYSTWLGKHGLYLEGLYVSQSERGSGGGRALLKHLAKIAVDKGCGRFEWSVLDWNEPAINFYKSLGAKPKDEWVGYQLTGQDLLELADS
ncbi:GNAT family N-acetyltransferase [Marinomonas mediterranea]|jgi:Acetyltransferase (GNAT) family.|uniref:Diamine N-acetyltransferase n=1 Tax=Marinomonas mediterranea (strain ATCC 700492 / JCM 21426 / NBRC 103028 / MMB-1) TaxID=717774 RepID=F2K304_MARM1|nr:GNAT family N-acetyltransferase [Marinomonas mediterranea]ADZ92393.1 Diamine N-acetyltransferase [Marinomonas mediterranea MMB-1]WCN14391.1 GNAT family N-acetyltransferase [Marinomonas mediterranea]WCN18443.1 GNAT family N-acetyltransferase [Marinomonas mediterranea MMB-1]